MTSITVAGGVYYERCIWPEWDHLYGSAGRAAAALRSHIDDVTLCTYARPDSREYLARYSNLYGYNCRLVDAKQAISFEYVHCLSSPKIRPTPRHILQNTSIQIEADVVLRFGMLEGNAIIDAERCIYDPQSAFDPQPFGKNGSKATRLAIVANRGEIIAMSGAKDEHAGASLLLEKGAEVVVVKSGPVGALVFDRNGVTQIPAHRSERVWTIGSGDVFAAIFAARWGAHDDSATHAALLASRAVADYAGSMSLPSPTSESLNRDTLSTTTTKPGRAYLAAPFFTLGQRWLVDEARQGLTELGIDVFSPVHDVGHGPAKVVADADLKALDECDRVFAILDGLDSGTIFEIGYARARGIPVYALAQSVGVEDLKMIIGSDCRVFDDFVTAMHHVAWHT